MQAGSTGSGSRSCLYRTRNTIKLIYDYAIMSKQTRLLELSFILVALEHSIFTETLPVTMTMTYDYDYDYDSTRASDVCRGTLVPHPNQENKTIGAENERLAREAAGAHTR